MPRGFSEEGGKGEKKKMIYFLLINFAFIFQVVFWATFPQRWNQHPHGILVNTDGLHCREPHMCEDFPGF